MVNVWGKKKASNWYQSGVVYLKRGVQISVKPHVEYLCSSTEDSITHVEAFIYKDRQHKLYYVAVEIDLLKSVVHEIVHEKLVY